LFTGSLMSSPGRLVDKDRISLTQHLVSNISCISIDELK
jgi:hypothetical protein